MSEKICLTQAQIQQLAEFAREDNQPAYTPQRAEIYEGDTVVYHGLIAFSGSCDAGVLALE
ncbi:hypothetical protein HMPREF1562_1963 [Providencia alcalifaciens F90-2004]|uniref:hypothetical protein n=1 Tax=Providencia alcalifaciens TaxID=126385 RepID=UPI0004521969|nr:hypothetical protein [Providencia alcalifaciens]ETT05645.1 hypothetical protein HMPREF1562_1963 [Providencia alcalifaciens F90-2004]